MEYMKLFEESCAGTTTRSTGTGRASASTPYVSPVEWFTTCFRHREARILANHVLDQLLAGCEDALPDVGLALIDEVENEVLGMD